MKLLHIDSAILGDHSVTRRLSAAITAQYVAQVPGLEVVYRDLAADPLAHLTGAVLAAGAADPADRGADYDDGAKALDDFLAADVVVIGAPMYNFGVPSQLKAWIDRVAVSGRTFRYTEAGPEGLAGGKTLLIASSRGGVYSGDAPAAAYDHQESYLRTVFGFLGVTDIRFIRAEGVNMGPEIKQSAIDQAEREIAAHGAGLRQAA